MSRLFSFLCSLTFCLVLGACSTPQALSPGDRGRIHRLGVTTGLLNREVTTVAMGITVFGNRSDTLPSAQMGLSDQVDHAIARRLSGFKVVALSQAESAALGGQINALGGWSIWNTDYHEKVAKLVGEAARAKNVDALLVVLPGTIFVHDNLPMGHGFMGVKMIGGSWVTVSMECILCDNTGRLLARRGIGKRVKLHAKGEFESIMSEGNPEFPQAFREAIDQAATEGLGELGL